MRLRRRRVILIAGALALIWLGVVLLTPPPSASQTNRRRYDDEESDSVVPKHLRTSYNAVKVGGAAGREGDQKYVGKEFADFEDFQPDVGVQGNNASVKSNIAGEKSVIKDSDTQVHKPNVKSNMGAEKLLHKDGDTQRHNNSLKSNFGAIKQSNSKYLNDDSALLEIEKDLIPKNISLVKSNPSAIWDAASWVKSVEIYPESAPQLGDVLHALSTLPVIHADVGYKGTQLKARFMLQGGQTVVFKPKR